MITYRATLDVPISTLRAVTGWPREHRAAHDVRPWQRAATVYVQALMKQTWKALRHLTLDPNRITNITAAALVLLHLQRGTR